MIHSNFYKYLSLIKLIIGLLIVFIDYAAINVFEDPIIAISILLVGCFFTCWGASFFFFFFIQKFFPNKKNLDIREREIESYKLSFLFGMYSLLNIILIFGGHRSKILGLILLGGFVLILYFLMMDTSKHAKKSE